jgi:hypothetical protein
VRENNHQQVPIGGFFVQPVEYGAHLSPIEELALVIEFDKTQQIFSVGASRVNILLQCSVLAFLLGLAACADCYVGSIELVRRAANQYEENDYETKINKWICS